MAMLFLIEDDESVRELLAEVLGGRHEVQAFADGESALRALADRRPAVLLSDIELPGLAGEDLARAARALRPRPRLVLMSGNSLRLARARSLADATLVKPCELAELWRAVDGP